MNISKSLLEGLRSAKPHLRPQIYFKASLTALSHAMEDGLLFAKGSALVIACFQQERFYQQEKRRYEKIAQNLDQVYVIAVGEKNVAKSDSPYITIPLSANDSFGQEWHLVIISPLYTACLVALEHASPVNASNLDSLRQFKGIWSFERDVSISAAQLLLDRILVYRPELAAKIQRAKQQFLNPKELSRKSRATPRATEIERLFAERLVNYLQASQFKQIRAYRTIMQAERRERLINLITNVIRSSLNPQEVLTTTVEKLGQNFPHCRCLIYRLDSQGQSMAIEYEFLASGLVSMRGQAWCLADFPLFQGLLSQDKAVAIADIHWDSGLQTHPHLIAKLESFAIRSCLLVPICDKEKKLGILELHNCGTEGYLWKEDDIALVRAIATQVGVALIQAQAYSNLENFNHKLIALERSQRNLIAIVGHELRTPLSTIQVCLESLATEPEMAMEFRQIMLETALTDSERLRQLVHNFLNLSRFEAGLIAAHLEAISFTEILDLAIAKIKSNQSLVNLPEIEVEINHILPSIYTDGELLMQLLIQLLDNACKFTQENGKVRIRTRINNLQNQFAPIPKMLEVIIADTGRGIENNKLEAIFERFYQEEGFLQRTVGGTGLGLVICRQIVALLGGEIWATSNGKNQGSEFHFTVMLAN
ncbi:sensor histidine kinase [Dulcicalothrix desertica PCC 7102]|uniref:histidine kinase n=1 Tax=Dulcicalothrix desertica PCC 7102 TaxID=232991 RepID=A0A3S1CFI5_9CYAN|nr:DICT sensory domain-containing protein [Dulcicalothrix desertica]RUT02442.1 sensor histidine kinase [Dulcicalothrix desertica PCC 7102]TWH55340.1 DICT domain-containing protein [Dulcicalothrix desertica PCC 7102]